VVNNPNPIQLHGRFQLLNSRLGEAYVARHLLRQKDTLKKGKLDALEDLAGFFTQWRTWWLLGLQDVQLRYRRSILGPFWISASQIVLILTLAFLWSTIFDKPFLEYLSFLGFGLLAWGFLTAMINDGCNVVVEHSSYLRNLPVPLSVITARVVWRNTIILIHNVVAVILVLFALGVRFPMDAWHALAGAALYLWIGYAAALMLGPIWTIAIFEIESRYLRCFAFLREHRCRLFRCSASASWASASRPVSPTAAFA
jgi:cellulose synthase/poly-beta-1,6-N-acetylglucosamine synthase-like glycosyltransferase